MGKRAERGVQEVKSYDQLVPLSVSPPKRTRVLLFGKLATTAPVRAEGAGWGYVNCWNADLLGGGEGPDVVDELVVIGPVVVVVVLGPVVVGPVVVLVVDVPVVDVPVVDEAVVEVIGPVVVVELVVAVVEVVVVVTGGGGGGGPVAFRSTLEVARRHEAFTQFRVMYSAVKLRFVKSCAGEDKISSVVTIVLEFPVPSKYPPT